MYIGGRDGNKHANTKLRAGRGTVGKTVVAGIKHRESHQVNAEVVDSANRTTLQQFVMQNTTKDAIVYTDNASAYHGLSRKHLAVKLSVGEYVRERVHTNGIESFWSMLKRGYMGMYHRMSTKHLRRYITEFQGRHNNRWRDTLHQMTLLVKGCANKQPKYADLIA